VNVAEVVGRTLAELGVAQAFGVIGSGNFEVTNALRAAGVPFVATRHEAGAATMADAYARMSGRVALVSVHQGCGLTNALTGVTEAAKSRTPLIVLAADTPSSATLANFRIDQDSAVTALGAVSERVRSAATAVTDTIRAYRTAVHERRTVVLNLPLDVQAEPAALSDIEAIPAVEPLRPSAQAVRDLAAVISAAERPVYIAGRGARGAARELAELASVSGALLATSAVAHGLFHDDPWSLGISGGFSSPTTAALIAEADLVVGWGAALTKWTTRQGRLLTGEVVQVDVEPDKSHNPVDLAVLGDAGLTAREVTALVSAKTGYRTDDVQKRIADGPDWPDEDLSTATHIDPRVLSARLDTMLPQDRVVAVDSGNFMGYPSAYLSVPDEYGFCFTQAFQSIGLGLFTAVGAALARPDRLPVCAVGDGGLLMSVAELETVVRLGIPMVIVVYNDQAYGAEVHHFGPAADLSTVVFPDTDIAAIARGFGCSAITVRTVDDLAAVTEWVAGARDRPLLIDAKIVSDGGSWWLANAFAH
jgi:thiamine pyrophosphate-dependent acetolactate synthase large subunit-like protein